MGEGGGWTRVEVVVDGNREIVEVDTGSGSVQIRGKRLTAKIVEDGPNRVVLEIDGEQVAVEGWASGWPTPEAPVDVDGERRSVVVEVLSTSTESLGLRGGPRPPGSDSAPRSESPPPPAPEGVAVMPPMPGKILELFVHEGERVSQGQRLLVLEAMKMRNEIVSPVAGRVSGLGVHPGDFVQARRPMMRIASD